MIIFRYLTKEVLTTLAGLTTLLLLIFLSNQLVNYLTRAAAGQIPGMIVLRLLMLEIPNLIGLLLPLGLFVALLIAYGRFYAENEMTVFNACGFSQHRLLAYTMIMASIVSVAVGIIMFWLSPIISKDRDHLLTSGDASAILSTVIPERFQAIRKGKQVFYVERLSHHREQASGLFMAEQLPGKEGKPQWRILTANAGKLREDPKQESMYIVLDQGHEYEGTPGRKDYRVASFDTYQARLPEKKPRIRKLENALPTNDLWPLNNNDPKKAAELHWRIAIPLMTLLLAFLAVPLCRVQPRQGKYAKLLPAILVYIFYANMLFVTRDWISEKQISTWLGMWWLHGLIFILGLILYFYPWLQRRFTTVGGRSRW